MFLILANADKSLWLYGWNFNWMIKWKSEKLKINYRYHHTCQESHMRSWVFLFVFALWLIKFVWFLITHNSLILSSIYCLLNCICLGSITSSRYSFLTSFLNCTYSTIQYKQTSSSWVNSFDRQFFCFKCCLTT